MKDYILSNLFAGVGGLYLCELPTGYGKTYTVVQAMKEYVDTASSKKKLIYLTTLNKNLPEEELLSAFNGDIDVYNRKVLRIRSNFDEVTEKLLEIEVPESFQTETYFKLVDLIQRYNQAMKAKVYDQEYVKDLQKRITENESRFRGELTRALTKGFANKAERKNAIRDDNMWKWIGELYPAVFTDDHQILLMSISKFMKRNSTLIEPSYEFLKSSMLEDAAIFIDEFDATKATILSEIIEKSLAVSEEYIGLFKQILRGLNPEYLSKSMTNAYKKVETGDSAKYSFDRVLQEAEEIETKYHINLSYKTAEEAVSRRQNFLLKDATYHTLFHNDKEYIRAAVNDEENRVDIFFEDRDEFYSHKNDEDRAIGIFGLLREINRFLSHFKLFLFAWSRHYMDSINGSRNLEDDAMTMENAMSSIMDRLGLNGDQQRLIMGELCNPAVNPLKKELLPDNSFYQQGLELFELEDSDLHHDSTDFRFVEVYDTPEKILAYLAEKATVYGISATAEVGSVIGNYDLGYLQEKLEEKFHATPSDKKDEIEKQLAENWKAYGDGRIKIHTDVIDNQFTSTDTEEWLEEVFDHMELASVCTKLIKNLVSNEYYIRRYCNLVISMFQFCKNEDMQSFLYLGMALPKKNHPEMDQDLVESLFQTIKEYLGQEYPQSSLFVLKSEGFDEAKENLVDRLAEGEKIYIISSYQTIGAGQNLQYKAPDKSKLIELVPDSGNGDKRHMYKDIDALYLADVTNLTINTYKQERLSAEKLLEMLFQIEELKENAELNFTEADSMIKLAFRSYTGRGHYESNILYSTRSVTLQANRFVMQAVGRMCRTFLKKPNIYLYIEKTLLEKLSPGELKKHILPPEMQELMRLREQLGTEYSNEEVLCLKKAEKISSFGMWNIRQILSRNWTKDSMVLWEELRRIVLTYPTASSDIWQSEPMIRKLYITSGKLQCKYLYSQYSDFRDVTIDFGMDKVGFRNSKRAKMKVSSGEIMVYEMSEENSGLQIAMKYPGMREFFSENGYASRFEENDYMMSPVLFHNIYKGALGEVAGSFILRRELGIKLSAIHDPNRFEFFDYEMAPDVYIDFKNWKFNYLQDRESVKKDIIRKMDTIGAKRVYIINLIGDGEYYLPSVQIDSRIVEIPGLINKDGAIIVKNLRMMKEEDFV